MSKVASGVGLQKDNTSSCSSIRLSGNIASGNSLNSDDGNLGVGEVPLCKVPSCVSLQSNGSSLYLRVKSSSLITSHVGLNGHR